MLQIKVKCSRKTFNAFAKEDQRKTSERGFTHNSTAAAAVRVDSNNEDERNKKSILLRHCGLSRRAK